MLTESGELILTTDDSNLGDIATTSCSKSNVDDGYLAETGTASISNDDGICNQADITTGDCSISNYDLSSVQEDSRNESFQCQECGKCFENIMELTEHVQSNHVLRRASSKLKTEKKSSSKQTTKASAANRPQTAVRRVYACSKCDCEMSSAEFNETGMCTSCLVKIQLEVICDDSELMMTCESFCEAVNDAGNDTENLLDGGVIDMDAMESVNQLTRDETTMQNVELEELSADAVFDMSNIAEAYAQIGCDKNTRYRCLICAKEFVRHKVIRKHMLSHIEVGHKCEVCDAEFKEINEMQEHMLSEHPDKDDADEKGHTGDIKNRYACGQCGKQFHHRASLFRHVETHSENLRFDCTECGKNYRHRADFQQHMRLKHLLKNLAVCRYCDRQFYLPGSLRAHLHSHRAEKSYKCRLCDKVYQRSDSLNNHMLVHTGESPYMCTQCGEQFKHRLSMYRHLDSHKDRELFRCELCARCFKHSNALKEHTKRFHSSDYVVISDIKSFESTDTNTPQDSHSSCIEVNDLSQCVKLIQSAVDSML